MTDTINRNAYSKLLAKVAPKIIETKSEYEEALREVEKLLFTKNKTIEEETLYDLLIMLVEKYETENYPLDKANPSQILQHLMEERQLNESDLVSILGSKEIVVKIMKGEYCINKIQAELLGKYFNVSPALFLDLKTV